MKRIVTSSLMLILSVVFVYAIKPRSKKEDFFRNFIYKFVSDSNFQMERVVFPLTFETPDWDNTNGENKIQKIDKRQYIIETLFWNNRFPLYSIPVFYDNYKLKFKDTGKMVYTAIVA